MRVFLFVVGLIINLYFNVRYHLFCIQVKLLNKNVELHKFDKSELWSDFETGMRKNDIFCFKLSYIIRFINTNVT